MEIDGFDSLLNLNESRFTFHDLIDSGSYLGLDISKSSTGFCIISENEVDWGTIHLDPETGPHAEALYRRGLREDLLELVHGRHFDCIIIEDVYSGSNPSTTRVLYALNSVIDGLIIDGLVTCTEFVRVQNGTWKSWLSLVEQGTVTRGLNDKAYVKTVLSDMGITASNQDMLDACGMIAGWIAQRDYPGGLDGSSRSHSGALAPLSECRFEYVSNYEDFTVDLTDAEIFNGTPRSKTVRELLAGAGKGLIYVTKGRVSIGNDCTKFGVKPLPFGGYLAFWREA